MLDEETRHLVAIEGVFVSKKEVETVVSRNSEERNVKLERINDFPAAPFINDFALTFGNTKVKPYYLHIKRTLHSQLLKK